MPDIFDQLTRDFPQQEGDIFDQIAPDSDESSSARGASSTSAPRSPVAAQNATSAGANPAPGSTAFAPQPSLQGQKAGAQMFGPLAAPGSAMPDVAPAAAARGLPAYTRPQVRRASAQQGIAPPAQQQKPVFPQTQASPPKQLPASASNSSAIQQPNWRYIAEHPEYPEYRDLYQKALTHLSPEEKREIVNKRIAAYPENQPKQLEPILEPEMGVQMGTRDVGPKAQAAMEQHSPVPQSAMPALATAKKYGVDPFDEMAAAGGDAGKEMLVGGAAAMTEGTSVPQPGDAVDPESGLPLPNPEDYTPEKEEKFRRDYPRTAGALAGIGEFAGSTVADPRSWPFFFAAPEVAGTRFLSRAANSTLQRAAAAGFTAQMAVGAAQQAAQVHEIWNRSDISLDEKYKAITELVLNAVMFAHSTRSMVRGESVPRPQSLDPSMVAEINAMGDEAKLQILARVMRKVAEQQKPENQTREAATPNTRPQQPAPVAPKMRASAPHAQLPAIPAEVRAPETVQKSADNTSAPPTQLAAIANRPDIPPGQKHELMANVIFGELTHQTGAASSVQEKLAVASAADDPVAVMQRYMQANGELPSPAESKVPSKPQISLDPERIAPIGRDMAQLSHADRQGVLINLHDKLTQAIFEQGKILAPDGQLHLVSSPAEAAKLAQQFINDSIQEHDERAAEKRNATQRIANPISTLRSSLIATPEGNAQAGINAGRIPEMGHGMTSDSPAVRRVKAEARPIRGQEPTVKVKQEPPAIQSTLTQPPALVTPEAASRIGQRDPQSGRTILQPSNDLIQNERLANQAAPELDTRLSRITESVPGAKFDRLRPQKGLERLQEKVADGKPPRTIGDNLAAQIVAPNPEVKDQLIARMKQEFPVINVDDKLTEPRDKAGYPSANVQVQMPNGSTAEVQIVAPEIQAITDQTHRLYTQGRNFPEGSRERAHYWGQAAAMHAQALEKFRARNAQEQLVNQLALGQRVVLKNGQTGKVVDFTKKFDRVVVRTSKGLKTVKNGDLTLFRGFKGGGPLQPPIQLSPKEARTMNWRVVRPGKGLPTYLTLDRTTTRVLKHVVGELSGVNATPYDAQRWSERVRRLADQQESGYARRKLRQFAQVLGKATDEQAGLTIAEKTADLPEHADTVSEELFHSVLRRAADPSDVTAGVPVEELADHRHLEPLRPRIEWETGKNDDLTIVAEAMNDVAMGEAVELTPEQAREFARDMWQAIAKYYGANVLKDFKEIYEYINDLRTDIGVTLQPERQIYVEKARGALDEVVNRGGNTENSSGADVRLGGGRRGKGGRTKGRT